MATNSRALMGALAIVAATVVALPVAKAIDAATLTPAPNVTVNRAAKGDQLAAKRPAAQKLPEQVIREQVIREQTQPNQKQRLMDGCDPLFSPVTMPSMAHVPGRCVG